jgi:AcrR family transcriptional regulator
MRTAYTPLPLKRERVLDAALAVAEREGLQRLSMRQVAAELGVSPMALYRHVRNKDDLLDGLVERLLAELELPEQSLPWDERLRSLAGELRALSHRRPELFGLLLQRRAVGEDATRARQVALEALRDSGLDDQAAGRIERLLSTVVMGFALSEATGRFQGIDVDAEFDSALELLARVVAAR